MDENDGKPTGSDGEEPTGGAESSLTTMLPLGIGAGIAVGAGVGVAIDNVGLGIGIGLALGSGVAGVLVALRGERSGRGDDRPDA